MTKQTIRKCNYCGEIMEIVASGCCDECNWEMYQSELSELIAKEEQEVKELEYMSCNSFYIPYRQENRNKYKINMKYQWIDEIFDDGYLPF
ncbi:hypothetical protein SAMN05880501_101138 [Ureibacillus xyleni]|uniref:Uncharacterized protein n=1 Tax=Ureibacillus xyleni TaxID=614648 RepID=A0A285R9C5_9BACL|nr:hypothetical protein [Ureibacillus xyleni]SOB90309.1 hypothetical protein SAMN05880501_101138 [Ureibacillus xyleni]